MSLPKLCEMNVASLIKIEGMRAVVINPAQGLVVSLSDPSLKFFSPRTEIAYFGEAHGEVITWKPFGESDQPQLNPEFERSVRTTAIPGGSEAA